eukprot:5990648-Pyramimonas_sp.AAC.1
MASLPGAGGPHKHQNCQPSHAGAVRTHPHRHGRQNWHGGRVATPTSPLWDKRESAQITHHANSNLSRDCPRPLGHCHSDLRYLPRCGVGRASLAANSPLQK